MWSFSNFSLFELKPKIKHIEFLVKQVLHFLALSFKPDGFVSLRCSRNILNSVGEQEGKEASGKVSFLALWLASWDLQLHSQPPISHSVLIEDGWKQSVFVRAAGRQAHSVSFCKPSHMPSPVYSISVSSSGSAVTFVTKFFGLSSIMMRCADVRCQHWQRRAGTSHFSS